MTLPEAAERARQLAVDAAKAGDIRSAIVRFTEAQRRAYLVPALMYNLGRVHMLAGVGHELTAAAWFRAYLVANPKATDGAEVRGWISPLESTVTERISKLFEQALAIAEKYPVESGQGASEGVRARALAVIAGYQYAAAEFKEGDNTMSRAKALWRRQPEPSDDGARSLYAPSAAQTRWAMTKLEAGSDPLDVDAELRKVVDPAQWSATTLVQFAAADLLANSPSGAYAEISSAIARERQTREHVLHLPVVETVVEYVRPYNNLRPASDAALRVEELARLANGPISLRPTVGLSMAALAYLERWDSRTARNLAAAAKPYEDNVSQNRPFGYYYPVDLINGLHSEALQTLAGLQRKAQVSSAPYELWLRYNVPCLLLLSRPDEGRQVVKTFESYQSWGSVQVSAKQRNSLLALAHAFLALAEGRTEQALREIDPLATIDFSTVAKPRSEPAWPWGINPDHNIVFFPGAAFNTEIADQLSYLRDAFEFAIAVKNFAAAVQIAERVPISMEQIRWLHQLLDFKDYLDPAQSGALQSLADDVRTIEARISVGLDKRDMDLEHGDDPITLAVQRAQLVSHIGIDDLIAYLKAAPVDRPESVAGYYARAALIHYRELLRERSVSQTP